MIYNNNIIIIILMISIIIGISLQNILVNDISELRWINRFNLDNLIIIYTNNESKIGIIGLIMINHIIRFVCIIMLFTFNMIILIISNDIITLSLFYLLFIFNNIIYFNVMNYVILNIFNNNRLYLAYSKDIILKLGLLISCIIFIVLIHPFIIICYKLGGGKIQCAIAVIERLYYFTITSIIINVIGGIVFIYFYFFCFIFCGLF